MEADKVTPNNSADQPSAIEHTVSSGSVLRRHRVSGVPVWKWLRTNLNGKGQRLRSVNRNIIIGIVISALIGFAAGWVGGHYSGGSSSILTGSLSPQKQIVTSDSQLIGRIAKTVGPSVVSVNVTSTAQAPATLFDFGGSTQTQQSAGTGIILTADGLVITNRHVVPQGTTNVSITLADGTQLTDVSVVGETNPGSSLDVAFLKINNNKGKTLTPAVLGDSSQIKVGDAVVAIGNALGQFQNTVTSGIISGYGRSVQASAENSSQPSESLDDLFQTDAAINEGNSGGPLVNLNGQVIGINTAIAGGAQSIGFAIPVNDIIGLIRQVENTGKLQQPYLGVLYIPLTNDIAQRYSLTASRGAWIPPTGVAGENPVVSGGPADKAGLQPGDIITQVDGTTIDQNHSLTSIIDKDQVGQTVTLTVVRGSTTLHPTVTLAAEPNSNTSG